MSTKASILALVLAVVGTDGSSIRSLSQAKIAGFEPITQVTDHNAIDLDQKAIEANLALKTDSGFANAKAIYEQGAFSKSYAVLELVGTTLTQTLAKDTGVSGVSMSGTEVAGDLYADAGTGDATIPVQYQTSDIQESYVNCQVGGNPEPNLEGCFNTSGVVEVNGIEYKYRYNPNTDNNNGRTIRGFSTDADERMRKNGNLNEAYYPDMKKFVDYYGQPNYADVWVTSALNGADASFANNGYAQFSSYGYDGRIEAVKKGTAYMNIAMYVIRELEDALDDCERGCSTTDCNDDAVHALDEAVAFYTGSAEGASGTDGEGYLMYALAQKRCKNFKTCGENGDDISGTAKVNIEIFRQFNLMQRNLRNKDCAASRVNKERITELMFVSLVQGTIRYAFLTGELPDASEKAHAEGAVFAAAVLPVVNACSESDAKTIYDNMRVGKTTGKDFAAVKTAFENNYECMGITCADVGGLWNDALGEYEEGAEPCGGGSSGVIGKTVAVAVAMFAVVSLLI